MRPTSIKKIGPEELRITWENGSASSFSFRTLRDQCPCAGCKGETVLLRSYVPPPPDTLAPGRYELVDLRTVGSYAMQAVWADGHDAGIFTWDYLEQLSHQQ